MQEFLNHPAVQAGVAPFVAALVAALLFRPLKLSGLAIAAGFAVAVYLIAGFEFTPLSTIRKIFLVGLLSPIAGIAIDLLGKRVRAMHWIVGTLCGALTVWVFFAVLKQKQGAVPWLMGGGVALFVAWLSGSMVALRADAPRAGAAALMLGLGVGVCAVLGASASFGQYGIALAASSGAYLLAMVMLRPGMPGGATLALPAALIAGLLAAGTLILASLPWAALAAFALIPWFARLPAPDKAPAWIKAGLFSVYALVPAIVACALAWHAATAAPS